MGFYVFKRVQGGKKAAVWSGRYNVERGSPWREVSLGLTDKQAAKEKLRQIAVEEQRAAVGILPKKSYRDAAQARLSGLLASYIRGIPT